MKTTLALRNFLFGSALLAAVSTAHAADGTYTSQTGAWNDPGSWENGIIADGFDSTAYFTNDVTTANRTTLLGEDRTIGHITFTDEDISSGQAFNRVLSGNILTLDVTTEAPVIDVTQSSRTLEVTSQISGNDGLTKSGPGQLTLSNLNNNFTGNILVTGGRLRPNTSVFRLGANPVSFTADHLTLNGGELYFAGNTDPLASGATLNMGNRGITLGENGGAFLMNAASIFKLNGTIAGAGTMRVNSFANGAGVLELVQANTFTGDTAIIGATSTKASILIMGHEDALQYSAINTTLTASNTSNGGLRTTHDNLKLGGLIGNKALASIFTATDGGYGGVGTLTLNAVTGANYAHTGVIADGAPGMSLVKTGPGQQYLNQVNNTYTGKTVVNGGTLRISGAGSFGTAPESFVADQVTLDDCLLYYAGNADPEAPGATVTMGNRGITLGAGGGRFIMNSGATFILDGIMTGSGGITVTGFTTPGILVLPNENTYAGDTTVSRGTLRLGAANPNNQSSTVTIAATDAKLVLAFAGTDTVSQLLIGTNPQPAGTYGHTDSGADNGGQGVGTLDAYFGPGSGTLTVEPAVAGGFAAWQAANGGTTGGLADDHDGDGVDNGTEYFLGGNTSTTGFTPLPGVTNNGGTLSVTWTKAATGYDGTYGNGFVVETSDTLVGTWATETLGIHVTVTGNDVKYTFPSPLGTKKFARLVVTGP